MLFLRWLFNAAAIILVAAIIPGISVAGWWTALWLVVLMALINTFIKPILIILTLPINILTLGLFTWIINALLVLFASSLVKGFEVDGFWPALGFSLVLALFNAILSNLMKNTEKV